MTGICPFLGQNLVLPLYDVASGTSRLRFGRVLQRTQWLPRHEIERIQNRNLRVLLKHAYDTVPYYRKAFDQRRLKPSDIKNLNDLARLPTLTKTKIRKHYADLVSRGGPRERLVPRKSGGTGDQIGFFVTKEQMSWEIAAEFRAYGWAGYRFGDRCLVLWGSTTDMQKNDPLLGKIKSWIEQIRIVNTYVASDSVFRKVVNVLERFNPRIIRGYASSVYMFAKYLLRHNVSWKHPAAVITSAETLHNFQRKVIEEVFACPVFDYYGSREIGAIASECEEHNGYHVSAENTALEFVREGCSVEAGENGLILVTSLRNFGMPLIRYEIGDVGTLSREKCDCGRGLPLVESIEGRVSQFMAVLDKKSGRVVPVSTAGPGVFSGALMNVPLERYRIVQEDLERVTIIAVKGKGYASCHTDFIIDYLRKFLGDNISIEINFVDYIPPLPSGKRSVFVSKLNAFEQRSDSW